MSIRMILRRCRLDAKGEQTLGREPTRRVECRVLPNGSRHQNMKPRQTPIAARSNTPSSRQHKSHLSLSRLPEEYSSVSMKSREGEPSVAPAATIAVNRRSFCAESPSSARDGNRKSGAEDSSSTQGKGEQDLGFGRAAAEEYLVNVTRAARFLAVSVSTLYGWVWRRRISFVKLGRAVRFDIADLRKFVKENRVEARRASKV
jgi:excisionase family DNA binding protein